VLNEFKEARLFGEESSDGVEDSAIMSQTYQTIGSLMRKLHTVSYNGSSTRQHNRALLAHLLLILNDLIFRSVEMNALMARLNTTSLVQTLLEFLRLHLCKTTDSPPRPRLNKRYLILIVRNLSILTRWSVELKLEWPYSMRMAPLITQLIASCQHHTTAAAVNTISGAPPSLRRKRQQRRREKADHDELIISSYFCLSNVARSSVDLVVENANNDDDPLEFIVTDMLLGEVRRIAAMYRSLQEQKEQQSGENGAVKRKKSERRRVKRIEMEILNERRHIVRSRVTYANRSLPSRYINILNLFTFNFNIFYIFSTCVSLKVRTILRFSYQKPYKRENNIHFFKFFSCEAHQTYPENLFRRKKSRST
jgi:hypothetical protein